MLAAVKHAVYAIFPFSKTAHGASNTVQLLSVQKSQLSPKMWPQQLKAELK